MALAWAGCTDARGEGERGPGEGVRGPGEGETGPSTGAPWIVRRPVVRPRGISTVWIDSPPAHRPVGYVSMEQRRVFVDRAHRDRVSWLLDAHISVSTGLWRIPLPGDAPTTPIPPGDDEREFEEMAVGAWDPSTEPAAGDVRILLGRRTPQVVPAGCVPIQGTGEWLATERLEHLRCRPGDGEAVREDFTVLGSGRRSEDRSCADDGVDARILGWACPT